MAGEALDHAVGNRRGEGRGAIQYSVQILLPLEIEERLRRWAEGTPGATWPRWGGHVTILGLFEPLTPPREIVREIADICEAFNPFPLRLSKVEAMPHWRRHPLHTVLLKGDRGSEGYQTILRLHNTLSVALATLKRDLFPEVSQRPYEPHVTLTWGVSEAEARRLAEIAETANLAVELLVDEIWLVAFSHRRPASPEDESRRQLPAHCHSFRLGKRSRQRG